jgi:hypothetical protein
MFIRNTLCSLTFYLCFTLAATRHSLKILKLRTEHFPDCFKPVAGKVNIPLLSSYVTTGRTSCSNVRSEVKCEVVK